MTPDKASAVDQIASFEYELSSSVTQGNQSMYGEPVL